MGYLTNFIVYTLAMVGVIVIALLVFKNATGTPTKGGSKFLKVHDSLSLGPRKTLYIVSAGDEKFLIAGDVDKTSLISKLNTKSEDTTKIMENIKAIETEDIPTKSFRDTMNALPKQKSYIDRKGLGIRSIQEKPYDSVMKNLAERIRG
jgi:flagellar biogenesis protein FliO